MESNIETCYIDKTGSNMNEKVMHLDEYPNMNHNLWCKQIQ